MHTAHCDGKMHDGRMQWEAMSLKEEEAAAGGWLVRYQVEGTGAARGAEGEKRVVYRGRICEPQQSRAHISTARLSATASPSQ